MSNAQSLQAANSGRDGEILQHEAQALVDGHDLNVTVSDENHRMIYAFYATSMAAPSMTGRE